MNVVWFVLDTQRADHLGCYGYFRDTSPNIDRLAAEGVVFEQSYASAVATGPGFTSLLTGRAAINHGFYLTPWNVPNMPLLDDNVPTLPEYIQSRGDYTTAAFDNLINFRSHMKQFVRGFEFYINATRSPGWVHHWILAEEVNGRLLPWLERHADEPFFAFVHYWDPHTPYNHPEKFRRRYHGKRDDLEVRTAPDGYDYVPGWGPVDRLPEGDDRLSIGLYDEEVYYVDHCVGEVVAKLDSLGLLDETAILVTADHGEDLDLHGLWGHGTAHETTIRVPLVMRDPQHLPQGTRISGYVQQADQAPTILEYFPPQDRPQFARVLTPNSMPELSGEFDGQSLLAVARGEAHLPDEIVAESGQHRAYLSPPWKLIWHKDETPSELFHLENDPLELHNRAADEPEKLKELGDKLEAWVRQHLGADRADPMFTASGAWTCYVGRAGDREN